MRRILPLELAGSKKLEFNLIDDKGALICKKGEELTPDLLIKLSYMKIYKDDGKVLKSLKKTEAKKKLEQIPKKIEKKSVIKETVQKSLVNTTKNILQKTYDNVPIKQEECTQATKIIIDEVTDKIDKIECINQLRVYDEYTYSHNLNVSSLSVALGMVFNLNEEEIKELALGAFLHDIGKMKIPKEVLNKPTALNKQEMEIMRGHPIYGYKYIKKYLEVPDRVARVALDHHERYYGSGYPNGLKGRLINIYSQITNIVDIYDALVSDRCYKKGMPHEKIINIIKNELAKNLNPDVLRKFLILTDSEKTEEAKEAEEASTEPNALSD